MQKLNCIPDLDLSKVSFKESRSTLLSYILYYRGGYNVKNPPKRKYPNTHKRPDIPVWEKSNLTVDEAAEYYNIGRDRLRQIIDRDDCPFVLWVSENKRLIRRKKFDEYLDNMGSL